MSKRIELLQGDITLEEADAIVNAANAHLAGGGGVDGAIHRAGGPAIMKEIKTKYRGGCPTGSAVITGAGNLRAKYVIHAVGPRYHGRPQDAELLKSAYQESLKLCLKHHVKTVSFPAISTGIYGYPLAAAAPLALETAADYLSKHSEIEKVRFVLYDQAALNAFEQALKTLKSGVF